MKSSLLLREEERLQDQQPGLSQQLPSPFSTQQPGLEGHTTPVDKPTVNQKRKAKSVCPLERPRKFPKPDQDKPSIDHWLSDLPENFETMGKPQSKKRSRRSASLESRPPTPEIETETTPTRSAKYTTYQNPNYEVVLETLGSFMWMSRGGISDDDRKMCAELLSAKQPIPRDSKFDDDLFEEFCSLLRGRSETRILVDLHPLLVPSAEDLCTRGQRTLEKLIDGYNDRWIKTTPFYQKLPQPDHTVGFRWSAFTEAQRHKLGLYPEVKSYFAAREDMYFPFLTIEVKCGQAALEVADRANANSMTIAVRGVVELFRMVGCPMEIHRRILAFSISHNNNTAWLYGHYPEIDGDKTCYYRFQIKQIAFGDQDGTERWKCHTFVRNIYDHFAPVHLKRIRDAVDKLLFAPVHESPNPPIEPDKGSTQNSQESVSSEPQEDGTEKPQSPKSLDADMWAVVQSLRQQLERQQTESDERQKKESDERQKESEERRKESEERRKESEEQRKESEEQRKESEEQRKELMQMFKQQSEQLAQLLTREAAM